MDNKRIAQKLAQALMGGKQAPFGPMGSGENIGLPPDPSRPRIWNEDGSFSTERTMTLPLNDKWYNVPTIVDGHQYPEAEIEQYFNMGLLPHVGEFPTADLAVRSARLRTQRIKP